MFRKSKEQSPAQRKDVFENYPVNKAVLTLAVPTIVNSLVTTIYNLVDTFWISATNNASMVAAVSLGMSAMMVLSAVGTIFSVGGSSLMSRCLGAKQDDDAKKTSAICNYMCIIWGLLVMIAALTFSTQIAYFVGAEESNLAYTKQYQFWCLGVGAIPTVLSMTLGAGIRSEGNAKHEMIGMTMGHIFNFFADPIFIIVLNMGVAGAALATMLSSLLSCIYFFWFIYRSRGTTAVSLNPANFKLEWYLIKDIMVVGVPSALEQLLNSASMIVMNRLLVSYGDNYLAAMGIVQKLVQIPQQASSGFTQGSMPLMGYNYAAKQYQRMEDVRKYAMKMTMIICLIVLVVYEILARPLFMIFLTGDEVVSIGVRFMRIYVISLPLMTRIFAYRSTFQALGMGIRSFIVSLCRKGMIFIPVVIIANQLIGVYGIVCAQIISDAISLVIAALLYRKVISLFHKLNVD